MRRFFFTLLIASLASLAWCEPYKLANLVCFVKFADQADDAWKHDFEYYETLFNASGDKINSVRNYFSDMSYGKLDWESTIVVTEYIDSHTRNYFCEKSDSNPEGYTYLDYILSTRIRTLVKDMCSFLNDKLPDDVVLDADGDGSVDNIVMIVNGNSERGSSNMLWPANNKISSATIRDLDVKNYLLVFDGANGYTSIIPQQINTGVLCHEMMHTLDAYDLYTSSTPKLEPVNVWDLMSDNQKRPQGLTAYMRMAYGKEFGNWLPENDVPVLSESGEYDILPISSREDGVVAYKVVPDPSQDEYFMIEYRDRSDFWDMSLPASGLLVSRVNPKVNGNLGAKHELYIFRPDGSTTTAGKISRAPLGENTGRLHFGRIDDADFPFYSDGTRAEFCITDVKKTDTGMSFRFWPETIADSAVGEIEADDTPAEDIIYTIQGIRIPRISAPGLYIVNGKKVIVK